MIYRERGSTGYKGFDWLQGLRLVTYDPAIKDRYPRGSDSIDTSSKLVGAWTIQWRWYEWMMDPCSALP
jgi:hypothetical protein